MDVEGQRFESVHFVDTDLKRIGKKEIEVLRETLRFEIGRGSKGIAMGVGEISAGSGRDSGGNK